MELIDKSEVVKEIKKRREEWRYGSSIEAKYKKEECDDILSSLNTLEVKEVNLEKEIQDYIYTFPHSKTYFQDGLVRSWREQKVIEIAKHFFEVGLKAQKGE